MKDAKPRGEQVSHERVGTGAGFEPRIAQLRALITIAREGSYTRAARQLMYTESAVFLQIRALERQVGLPVVARKGPRIELTPAGEVVLRYAMRIVEDVEALSREVEGLRGSLPVVIGGGRSTSVYYLTPILAEFSIEYPQYQVQLHILPADELVAAAEDGLVDLAASGGVRHLRESARQRSDLRFTPWFHGGWAIAYPVKKQLSELTTVYVPDFAWFLAPAIRAALQEKGCGDAELLTLASGEAVKSAVLHGMGGAVLPAAAISIEWRAGVLGAEPVDLGPESVMLVHRRPRFLTEGARELLRYMVRARRRFNRPLEMSGSKGTL